MTTAELIAFVLDACHRCQIGIDEASNVVAGSSMSQSGKASAHASLAKASGELNESITDLTVWKPDPAAGTVQLTLSSSKPYKIVDLATNAVVASGSGKLEVEF